MLTHAVFSDPTLKDLSGDSFRLFIWMSAQAWKYCDSIGLVRASISYISNGTGLSDACVSRSLKGLQKVELVSLYEKNFKLGNLWKISEKASWRKTAGFEKPHVERAQKEIEVTSDQLAWSRKVSRKLTQKEGQLISLKNSKKNTKRNTPTEFFTGHPAEDRDEYERKVEAFGKAFEGEKNRRDAVQRYVGNASTFKSFGPVANALAINRWWVEKHAN